MMPDELITQLDECFRGFDHILEKYGIEKIKTIGDCYMCASGLPTDKDDNAVIAVNAALDMMEFMNGFNTIKKIQNLPAFELRIGINTGPVVAGVVGITKFAYDIWGDTVNLASRLEHKSEPGKINISEATWSLIKDHFDCNFRGKIAVKSKGEIDMYFVERKTKTQFAAGEK
jgi:class 3 adenylate cyclase